MGPPRTWHTDGLVHQPPIDKPGRARLVRRASSPADTESLRAYGLSRERHSMRKPEQRCGFGNNRHGHSHQSLEEQVRFLSKTMRIKEKKKG